MQQKLLKAKMIEHGCSVSDLANELNQTEQAIYYKLQGKRNFNLPQIKQITDLLNLSIEERDTIFFAD